MLGRRGKKIGRETPIFVELDPVLSVAPREGQSWGFFEGDENRAFLAIVTARPRAASDHAPATTPRKPTTPRLPRCGGAWPTGAVPTFRPTCRNGPLPCRPGPVAPCPRRH